MPSTVAEIFRRQGADYRARMRAHILPSHRRVMEDIVTCRTPARGGHLFWCEPCHFQRFSYHSCQNRHCPRCQNEAISRWLHAQRKRLLPVAYFLFTFTLPAALRPLAYQHQRLVYGLLFRAAAAAMQGLAADPRYLGARLGFLAVLHTWTRDLRYHPHLHLLVPAGGLASTPQQWIDAPHEGFLLPVKALAILFRAKLRDALAAHPVLSGVPPEVWSRPWVVHAKPAGSGLSVLRYFAPYIYRIALCNNRIVTRNRDRVTFTYRDRQSGRRIKKTLPALEFMQRYLQHVLPRRFVRVRSYGFQARRSSAQLEGLQKALGAVEPPAARETQAKVSEATEPGGSSPVPAYARCPRCGQPMHVIVVPPASPLASTPTPSTFGPWRRAPP